MGTRLSGPGDKDLVPRPRKRPIRKTKYDWETIRREYTEGIPNPGSKDPLDFKWLTLVELARRHNIPEATVLQRSGKEHWSRIRQSIRIQMDVKRKRERAKLMAKEGQAFDTTVLKISQLGLNTILLRMSEVMRSSQQREQMSTYIMQQMERGELVDLDALSRLPDFDPKEMEQLSNAAARFTELGRGILGEPVEEDVFDIVDAEEFGEIDGGPTTDDNLADMLDLLATNGVLGQLVGQNTMKALTAIPHAELEYDEDDELEDEPEDLREVQQDNVVVNRPIFGVAS